MGDGTNRSIPHSLGQIPGMIVVKSLTSADDWFVYHRSLGASYFLQLNQTGGQAGPVSDTWSGGPTDTTFGIGTRSAVNTTGSQYVAYLFAHDTEEDGIIQCGSFTTDASGNFNVNLGWEPQYLLFRRSSGTDNWAIADQMRGLGVSGNLKVLMANTSTAEGGGGTAGNTTATGFENKNGAAGIFYTNSTYIYLAIRRPNKPPTSGTEVYNAIARTGTGAVATVTGVGFAPDLAWVTSRSNVQTTGRFDRLRGANKPLRFDTSAESTLTASLLSFDMDGVSYGAATISPYTNTNTVTYINHFFRRAPGIFDIVTDTGTGGAHTVTHGLTTTPELIIRKGRSGATQWEVWHSSLANTQKLVLNSTDIPNTDTTAWNSTLPTSTQFTVGTGSNVNTNGATYVTYLFGSLPGISKAGAYIGNGGTLPINCGFKSTARFVLIKRVDAAGNWFIWDSARGINSFTSAAGASDPTLSLNSTAAEMTTYDSLEQYTLGFYVKQNTTTNINVSGGKYIFFAIS